MNRSPHPFGDLIGLQFKKTAAGESECALEAREGLFNPQNVLHGAVLYALADTGMGGALYPLLEPGQLCATTQLSIAYHAAVKGGTVTCRTRVINKGKRTATLESEIENDGRTVASALGSFAIFKPGGKPPG